MKNVKPFVSACLLGTSLFAASASPVFCADKPDKKPPLKGDEGPAGLVQKPAPALSFKAYGTNQHVDLKDYLGKLVVVDFFNAQQGRDAAEFDALADAERDYSAKGVVIIGVSTDVNQNEILKLLKKKNIDWPFDYDPQGWAGNTASQWHIAASTGIGSFRFFGRVDYLISPDGMVLWTGTPDGVDKAIKEALKDHKPQMVNPRTLDDAKATLEKVKAALTADHLAEAYRQRAHIPRDAKNDEDFAGSLKETDDKLQSAGDAALAAIDPLIADKQFDPASAKLKELLTTFEGSTMVAKVRAKQAEMQKDPAFRKKPRSPATSPNQTAPTTSQAVPAAKGDSAASRAKGLLGLADSYRDGGNFEKAKVKYKEVIAQFPGTEQAKTAKEELEKLPE